MLLFYIIFSIITTFIMFGITIYFLFSDKPRVTVSFESQKSISELKEGDSFTLLCRVRSNPGVTQIVWTKEVSNQ